MSSKPKVISLFSGAGGIDYGFEAAGFDTRVAVEMDRDCCETMRLNRPRWNVIEKNVFDVTTIDILNAAGVQRGDVDVLVGGPPCQPFSKSGYWANGESLRLNDSRASTLGAYLRVVEEAMPRALLLENVEGLAYSGKDEGMKLLLGGIDRINKATGSIYRPTIQVLNAADYGVPQLRNRVFMIAARDGTHFNFPSPTHRERVESDRAVRGLLPPYRTAWDALADVRPSPGENLAVRGKWARLLPSIPEGGNYLHHTDRGEGLRLFGWRRRYWNFLLKLAKRLPSWTVQAKPGPATGPFHWENRLLSQRELCRIQTFPDNVSVYGGRASVQQQVGNAVPSLLAEVLGRAIRQQILGLSPLRGTLTLMPPDRWPPPPPEPAHSVPSDFLALVGDHDGHPGTGKGYGVLDR